MSSEYYIYIIADQNHNYLYTGICDNLKKRMQDHLANKVPQELIGLSLKKLLYVEKYDNQEQVVIRHRLISSLNADAKLKLIKKQNPSLKNLHQ